MNAKVLLFCCLWGVGVLSGIRPATSLQAQMTGLLTSDERYAEVPVLPTYSGTKFNEIPPRVSLKRYCPVPADQRQTSTCVGWALGYGLLTIQRAILSNQTDQAFITQQAHSAAFLFNQLQNNHGDCAGGAYIEDALLLLKEKGDCLESSFNFEKYGCSTRPSEVHFAEAARYRIQDFASVFELNEDPKVKISKICKVLAARTPVAVGMGVTKSFLDILPGMQMWNPDPAEPLVGYHAMVLIGYNSVEKYFELLNSFGPSWGLNGFIRLPYDDFERLCRYAYVLVPAPQTPLLTTSSRSPAEEAVAPMQQSYSLSGAFVFRQPAGFVMTDSGDELMYFEEIEARLHDARQGVYRTRKAVFPIGDVFQLVARDVPRGCHVYVFSRSPDGTINVHFPRKAPRHSTSASFMLDKTAELIIPDEDHLLQLPSVGDDHLCILYSSTPIADFDLRLRQLSDYSGNFYARVHQVFNDYLIPIEQVRYETDRMMFSARAEPAQGRTAVALILTVTAQ